MAISKYEEMGDLAIDMLKEIGSIGGGNAATALSSMLNAKVNMALPEVKVLGFNAAMNLLGNPEELVAAIVVELSGELEGVMLFILTKEFVDEIMQRVVGKTSVDMMVLDDLDTSVLTEIGNIVISSYITAMSSLVNVEVDLSVPQFTVNMVGGILSLPIAVMGQYLDKIMMIKGRFQIDGKAMDSDMLLLPDVKTLNVLMKKLGVIEG